MTLFDELKAQNDQIKALVVKVAADVATLTAAIKPDMTPAEVSELKADGQSIVDALSALDEQTPDEPVTPPQAKKK